MLPTLDRDGNDCRDREVVTGRDVSQRNKEAGQRPGKEGIMKVGDLVRTMGLFSGQQIGIIDAADPKSLHGPGFWVTLCTGERVSRHPGDIEVLSV